MAKKIKVIIETPEKNIRLPGIGVKTAIQFVKFGLWGTRFFKDSDEEMQQFLINNKELIIDFLETLAKDLKQYDPFTLVEIQSDDSHILIKIL